MASNLSAQLKFLTDASHLLAAAAPETSAYLMRRRNNLMVNHDLELSDVQRQHACTSCGHIMILGQGTKLEFEPRKSFHSRTRSRVATRQPPDRGMSKVFICASCSRETRVAMSPPQPIARGKKPAPPTAAAGTAAAEKPPAHASSKRRAKDRKAGLQALLLRNQAAAVQPSRLSLSDFMKKP